MKNEELLEYYKTELKWNPPFADAFSKYAPEALKGYLTMRGTVKNGTLPSQTRELIFTLLDSMDDELSGAKAHAVAAIEAGMTMEELVEAFVIVTMVKGINVMCKTGAEAIKAAEERFEELQKAAEQEKEKTRGMKVIHHICIQTNHYRESLDFYTRILGFDIIKETENFHGRDYNTWLDLNSFMIELQTKKEKETLSPFSTEREGIVHFCLYVEDLQKEYERLKALGCVSFRKKNGEDIYLVEGGKLLKIAAPEGTIVELRDSLGL